MTQTPSRPLLPLTPVTPATPSTRHGSRSFMTCFFRCGNACDHPEPNRSGNGHIQEEITKAVQRRSVLKGAAIGTGALVVGSGAASGGLAAAAVEPAARALSGDLAKTTFKAVKPNKRDAVTVAEGFTTSVVMRWGDRVVAGAPAFDVTKQTPEAARQQFGYNCDYVGVLPTGRDEAVMVVNHEYTDENLMFPADTYTPAEIKAIAMSNYGISVVELRRGAAPGDWRPESNLRKAKLNRRLHIESEFKIVGPAAGDERLKTVDDPSGRRARGTLNNCAGGLTPWGTALSGEENFNSYFDKSGALDPRYTAQYARYGITGSGKGWNEIDPRFDLTLDPHEPHRFGWIVEVDPTDPSSTPRKHTMLGRFKHEGANIVIAKNGKAVAYMGDDERGDYIYRFVSAEKFDPARTAKARRHNLTLLTKGTLSVAKFSGDGSEDGVYDGTGQWIPLCTDTTSYVEGMSVADVLIFTRLAADKVGPTKMDRPEDVEPNLVNGKVYAALTNNSNRGKPELPVDEANPIASSMVRASPGAPLTSASGNRNGYVLEMTPTGGHAASGFTWDLLLVCGDPAAAETYFGGVDKSTVSPISCPDNVSFDSEGQLWIATDGNVLGSNDGIFRVPTEGPLRGQVRQFVTMPRGAEACGPLIYDKNRSLFFAVQHPGEIDGATFENQASTWPHTDDFPRPSVVVAFQRR
ncbi:PhoX family phosphatase [Nocardioides sp.]|uniref:PhoX family protein n=1 Tax=Nocardioides sp. TaxID=35761 RepID=UPI00286C80C8|nr:PhoX family phosphatase [Nocardioides sp.]